MALINCPECGKKISDKAGACPNCGFPIAQVGAEEETFTFEFTDNGKQTLLIENDTAKFLKKGVLKKECAAQDLTITDYKPPKGTGPLSFGTIYLKFPKDIIGESIVFAPSDAHRFSALLEFYGYSPAAASAPAKKRGGFCCPKCKSHNIDLWDPNANTKEFHRTGLNLNPLHPLTFTKTKTVKKQKKKHNEYFCRDCGHRWIGK